MKVKIIYLIYLAIALVGIYLLTDLWLPSGYVVAGHDSGLALNALDFLKTRFFTWDVQGFGRDNSTHFGSLTIHSVDYILSAILKVSSAGNQLTLFYWLAIIFIAGFIFANELKNKLGRYVVFLFPVFITFNFYILQSLFIIERAKYSVLVASLLILTIVFRMQQRKSSILFFGLLSSLILFFFNCGSWWGLPLYGGFFVIVFSLIIFELIKAFKENFFSDFWRIIRYLIVVISGYLALNAYSIAPYILTFFTKDIYSVSNNAVITQNKAWLDMISQATSFFNIFRLQGVPDWYSSATNVSSVHSYASYYLSNPFLMVLSFIFPLLIVVSFILVKTREQKKIVSFMGLTMLLSMFLMAGSHKPLGFLYEFIYENVPGFSVFRSPYYKFGTAFFIAASTLISFTLSVLIEKLTGKLKNKIGFGVGISITFILIAAWFGYHFIVFSPDSIFSWQKGFSTKFKVPEYVKSFPLWLKENVPEESRIILAPPINEYWQNDAYNWGYWSLTNLPSVISNYSFVAGDGLKEGERYWVDKLYSFIKDGKEKEAFDLSARLGIDYILLRLDVLSDYSWSAASLPKVYEKSLNSFTTLRKEKSFNQWVIYKFDRKTASKLKIAPSLTGIPDGRLYLSQEFLPNQETVYSETGDNLRTQYLSKFIETYSCQSCPLELKDSLTSLPKIRTLSNSPFYYLKLRREDNVLNTLYTDQSKIDFYLGLSIIRASEIKMMIDNGVKDRHITDTLKKLNKYLKDLYGLFQPSVNTKDYFFLANRVKDNLNVIEKFLKIEVSKTEFQRRDENCRQEMVDALWNIKELKNIFPIIDDKQTLRTDKIYYLNFLSGGEHQVFLDINSLPKDLEGEPILPNEISYILDEKETDIVFGNQFQNFLELKLPSYSASAKLKLKFYKPVDLFVSKSASIEESPLGKRNCLVGKINGYVSTKQYQFEISVSEKNQFLWMYIKDADGNKGNNNFIFGQDEKEVFQTVSYEPFSYLYYPSVGSKDSTIYLCSGNLDLPKVDHIQVYEIFSPNIISVKSVTPGSLGYPDIKSEKISNTAYKVNVNGADEPYILIFNEAYNPLWKVKKENYEHFMINGYANAWLIDKKGNYNLILEYSPQRYFYYGAAITAISLFSMTFLLIYLEKMRKKRQD